MEIINGLERITPAEGSDTGFIVTAADGTVIDASRDVDENGVTIGLGNPLADLEPGEFAEARFGWDVIQAMADELNEMLRQARREQWI